MKVWFRLITILLATGLVACAPEVTPTPQQTPETELAEPVPVTVERVELTLTATPLSTTTPAPTSTPQTEAPIPTNAPLAEATATSLPELVWSENFEFVSKVGSDTLVWSPVKNEFVFDMCQSYLPENKDASIVWLASEPIFVPNDISPSGIVCNPLSEFIWHPNGNHIVFNGVNEKSPIATGNFADSSRVFS